MSRTVVVSSARTTFVEQAIKRATGEDVDLSGRCEGAWRDDKRACLGRISDGRPILDS